MKFKSNLRTLKPEGGSRPEWLPRELFPFTSRFVDIDGARIHYVDEGDGPIMLFLHGAPSRMVHWPGPGRHVGWSLKEYPKVRRMLSIVSSPIFGFLQERTNFLMKYSAGTFRMSADEREAFLTPYADTAARRNPSTLLGDLAGNDAYMNDIEQALRTQLNHLPVLLIWGDKGPVFEFLPRFQKLYPQARTLVIPGAHHFPFADAPNEMIAAIRSWWADAASTISQQKVS